MSNEEGKPSYEADAKLLKFVIDSQGEQLKEIIKTVQDMKVESSVNLAKLETRLTIITSGIAIVATAAANLASKYF